MPAPSSAERERTASGFGASLSAQPDAARALAIALRDLDVVQRRIRKGFSDRLGLSIVEFNAVMLIAEQGELTPKTLATELTLTPGAVTAMMDRLEAADLVRRWPHPTDRRSLMLTLGSAGESAKEQVYTQYAAAVAAAVAANDVLRDPRLPDALAIAAEALKTLDA